DRVVYGIRLLKNDTLRTWGKLNALRGAYALHRENMLALLPADCIDLLIETTSIDDFYDRERKVLRGAPTNYYQVAMACSAFREMIGWDEPGESDTIKDRLLGIMEEFSGGGWMDEQPPYGRYDRYSMMISAELIDTLTSIGKPAPEFALKNLADAAKLALECANPTGDGVLYGRSLSVHGDCAYLEIISTALRNGLIPDDKKQLAISYCGAILRHTFDFWFDSKRNSYNLWFDGRTTNNYRQIRRLLEVNLDMAIHMLTTLDNLVAAGCADMETDIPLPLNPHDFSNPSKTVFSDRKGEKRVLYSFVRNGKLYQLPLICPGKLALCAAYLPFPTAAGKIEAPPETQLPFLTPYFTDPVGRTYIPSGFYSDIRDIPIEANGDRGTLIITHGNMGSFGSDAPSVEESSIEFTATYAFIGNKIMITYEALTELPLECRALYAYGSDHCYVTFNGTVPTEVSVSGNPKYFTPHGQSIAMKEYRASVNKLEIILFI
ncbi:MAG: hypothetical protein IJY04_00940, partial [Clostridia bacterium]|nr:hypothetical protein [Clostridia bacterium]